MKFKNIYLFTLLTALFSGVHIYAAEDKEESEKSIETKIAIIKTINRKFNCSEEILKKDIKKSGFNFVLLSHIMYREPDVFNKFLTYIPKYEFHQSGITPDNVEFVNLVHAAYLLLECEHTDSRYVAPELLFPISNYTTIYNENESIRETIRKKIEEKTSLPDVLRLIISEYVCGPYKIRGQIKN